HFTDTFLVLLPRNLRLKFHDFFHTGIFHFLWYIIFQNISRGIFLMGIGEAAQSVKTLCTDPLLQLLEAFFRFARETDNKGGTNGHIRHHKSEFVQQRIGFLMRGSSLHCFKYVRIYMLKRYINIVANLWLILNDFQYILRKTGRKGIMKANPLNALHSYKSQQQIAKCTFFIDVQTVVSKILRDKDKFLHTFLRQLFSLNYKIFYGC